MEQIEARKDAQNLKIEDVMQNIQEAKKDQKKLLSIVYQILTMDLTNDGDLSDQSDSDGDGENESFHQREKQNMEEGRVSICGITTQQTHLIKRFVEQQSDSISVEKLKRKIHKQTNTPIYYTLGLKFNCSALEAKLQYIKICGQAVSGIK